MQEHLRGIFSGQDIATYEKERDKLRDYLGMPKAETQLLSDKLNKFLLDNEGEEIALPIKPILLLNLLLLVNNYEDKDMDEVTLFSFKKWYVTDKTRKQLI
jgi:hypothetical protein